MTPKSKANKQMPCFSLHTIKDLCFHQYQHGWIAKRFGSITCLCPGSHQWWYFRDLYTCLCYWLNWVFVSHSTLLPVPHKILQNTKNPPHSETRVTTPCNHTISMVECERWFEYAHGMSFMYRQHFSIITDIDVLLLFAHAHRKNAWEPATTSVKSNKRQKESVGRMALCALLSELYVYHLHVIYINKYSKYVN